MSLPITINGNDYTGKIQYTERSETMRRVQGPNVGTARNGDAIFDDLARKYDLSCSSKPMLPTELAQMVADLSGTTVTVTYYSAMRNSTVTQTMRLEDLTAVVGGLTNNRTTAIISNVPLVFKQK